jgi:hypothetical protein
MQRAKYGMISGNVWASLGRQVGGARPGQGVMRRHGYESKHESKHYSAG